MLRHERPGHYDTVVANFFLNVFTEPMMEAVLARLATMLKPGGKLLIGDFSYPRGWITTRAMQRAYYYLSMFSFWLLGGTRCIRSTTTRSILPPPICAQPAASASR